MRVEILGQERRRRCRDEQTLEIVMSVGIDGQRLLRLRSDTM